MDIVIIAFGFAGYLHFVALILKAFLWGWWVGLWSTPPEAVGLSLIYAGLNPSTEISEAEIEAINKQVIQGIF